MTDAREAPFDTDAGGDPTAPPPFPYMRWAKRHLTAFSAKNLGMSGIGGLTPADVAPAGPTSYWLPEGEYGDPDLRRAVAVHEGVPADHVFASAGASLANFLVHLATARGGEVAVETPAYEALFALPPAVGAAVTTFARDPARGWRIDPDALRAAVGPRTRLLVVTDLHNPTGRRLEDDELGLLLDEAERVGAYLLVDEVYRELDPRVRPNAMVRAGLGHPRARRVVVTNSLTKAHGLGGLRVGWILAAPALVESIARWNDIVNPAHAVPSLAVAKAYLPSAAARVAVTRARADAHRALTIDWVRGRRDVAWSAPDGGITGLLALPPGTDDVAFAETARRDFDVVVVPGRFFRAPGHVRLSFGLAPDALPAALARLGEALDALGTRPFA